MLWPPQVNLFDPAFKAHPYPARGRTRGAPHPTGPLVTVAAVTATHGAAAEEARRYKVALGLSAK